MSDADRVRNGAVEALRAASGLSLIVFPAEGLRATLSGGRRLADLTSDEMNELRDGASELTVSEGIVEREGEPWLVQQTGPAWAVPDEASSDLCGMMFTRLDGSAERHGVAGRPPGPLPADDELLAILEAALSVVDEGGEDDAPDDESRGAD